MTKGTWFWIFIILWLIYPYTGLYTMWPLGINLLLFLALVFVGWSEFGPPVKG